MKKRIGIVSNTTWSIYNFRLNLANKLHEKGYEVYLIAPYDSYSEKIDKSIFHYCPVHIQTKGKNPFSDLLLLLRLYKLFKKLNLSLVLLFTIKPNIYGSISARFSKIKVINNITGLGTIFQKKNLLAFFVKKMYRFAFRKVNQLFFQNKDDLQLFQMSKLFNCPFDVLPGSGVDLNVYKPVRMQKNRNSIHFLFIGRMIEEKGVRLLVEATKKLKDKYDNISVKLLGAIEQYGSNRIDINEITEWESVGIIEYLGTHDNVREIIAQSDVVVLPSYYREGVPRSLLEAAAMAKPIITADSIGCREVVDHTINGLLCKPADVNSLYEAMESMIAITDKKRAVMGKNGRKKIEKEFDEKIVIDKYLFVINNYLTS